MMMGADYLQSAQLMNLFFYILIYTDIYIDIFMFSLTFMLYGLMRVTPPLVLFVLGRGIAFF